MLEKMEPRLASWMRMYLSNSCKVMLIQSMLSILPTFFLSIFPLPGKVALWLEKLQWDFFFFWGGRAEVDHLLLLCVVAI